MKAILLTCVASFIVTANAFAHDQVRDKKMTKAPRVCATSANSSAKMNSSKVDGVVTGAISAPPAVVGEPARPKPRLGYDGNPWFFQ